MQINRLFEIIYLLLEQDHLTARELAKRFEVSTRTIYRDIETLSGAGIPVYMNKGKGGGISLLPDFILNKTVLTKEEKAEILSSLRAIQVVNPRSMDQSEKENSGLSTAVQKLGSLFGEMNTDWIEVDFSSWSNAQEEKELFQKLKDAILKKNLIIFDYANGKGESSSRKVEPLKLIYKSNSWYLYGYCREKQDFRFFKLHRMKKLEILEELYERKAPAQIFAKNEEYHCRMINLRLKIEKQMAYRVYDEMEHYEVLDNGDFLVNVQIPEREWMYQYLYSFGEHCEVLEPIEIREELRRRLESTLKKYNSTKK